jgi:hypothetical protein
MMDGFHDDEKKKGKLFTETKTSSLKGEGSHEREGTILPEKLETIFSIYNLGSLSFSSQLLPPSFIVSLCFRFYFSVLTSLLNFTILFPRCSSTLPLFFKLEQLQILFFNCSKTTILTLRTYSSSTKPSSLLHFS